MGKTEPYSSDLHGFNRCQGSSGLKWRAEQNYKAVAKTITPCGFLNSPKYHSIFTKLRLPSQFKFRLSIKNRFKSLLASFSIIPPNITVFGCSLVPITPQPRCGSAAA